MAKKSTYMHFLYTIHCFLRQVLFFYFLYSRNDRLLAMLAYISLKAVHIRGYDLDKKFSFDNFFQPNYVLPFYKAVTHLMTCDQNLNRYIS